MPARAQVCCFIALLHGTFDRAALAALALACVGKAAAGTGTTGQHLVAENAMRELSTTLRHSLEYQMCAAASIQAHLVKRAVLVGLSVPNDNVHRLVGHCG